MGNIVWELTGYETKATEDDIRRLENELNIKFPKEYVKIVKQYNGASPVQSHFECYNPHKKWKFGSGIGALLSVVSNDKYNIQNNIKWLKVDNQIPDKIIPFGEVGNGDNFCFDYRNSTDNPNIVYFSHEFGTDEDNTSSLFPLANNFTEFLEMLREPEDDED